MKTIVRPEMNACCVRAFNACSYFIFRLPPPHRFLALYRPFPSLNDRSGVFVLHSIFHMCSSTYAIPTHISHIIIWIGFIMFSCDLPEWMIVVFILTFMGFLLLHFSILFSYLIYWLFSFFFFFLISIFTFRKSERNRELIYEYSISFLRSKEMRDVIVVPF